MSQQTIGLGASANDGTGDDLRSAGGKINDNFTELYGLVAAQARYKFAVNGSSTADSMAHQLAAAFAQDDVIYVNNYDANLDPESGGVFKVLSVRGAEYGGTVGTLTNGGSSGLIIEGLWHRFIIVPTAGGRIDIRRAGIRCVEGVTGWHSRFSEACAYAKSQIRVMLTGSGVLSCTETVYLDRVNCDFSRLRFQGGTHAPNGATVGPSTFFTASQSNNLVTITSANPGKVQWVGHGLANDTPIYLTTNGKLPGSLAVWNSGVGNGLLQYYVRNVGADDFEVSLTSGGASISTVSAAGFGDHYVFQAGTQNNITTQDIVEWNGKGVRLGIVVRAATNGSNKDLGDETLTVWGDGNSDRTTPPSCICIRHEADDSPNGVYNYSTNYGYIGVGIQGPAEKHTLNIRGIYHRHLVYVLANASADTLRARLHSANCQAWYTEADGLDTSISVDLDVESRDDPASDASAYGADAPAALVRNGKATAVGGEMRANNGKRCVLVWGVNNVTGAVARIGADTVNFKNLQLIHGYGIAVELRAVRFPSGNILVKDWDDTNGGLAGDCPAFIIGRVLNAGGLHVHGVAIKNAEGLVVGDAATLDMKTGEGYYSKQANLGHWAIDAGTSVQFNPDGSERTGASAHPTTLTAVRIEKWDDCVIDLSGTRGNITLDATCEGGTMVVDSLAKLFTIADSSSPATSIGYPSLSTTGLTIT